MALFLSANICEGDDLVSIHSSRGKQCAFMSLPTALLSPNGAKYCFDHMVQNYN